jgi:hypothetical protein
MRRVRALVMAVLLAIAATVVPVQAQSRRAQCTASSIGMGAAVLTMFAGALFPPVGIAAAVFYAANLMVFIPAAGVGMSSCRR